MAILKLGEKFYGVSADIIIESFTFTGAVHDSRRGEEFDKIEFQLANDSNVEPLVEKLKEVAARYIKSGSADVTVYTSKYSNNPEKRVVVVRMPYGSEGMRNPSAFSFGSEPAEFHY